MGKKTKRVPCPNCTGGYRGGYRPVQYTDEKGKKRTEQEWFNDLPCTACDSSGSITTFVDDD